MGAAGSSSMEVRILGQATARPACAIDQRDAAEVAARLSCRQPRERRLLSTVFRQAGIRRRGSVLLADGGDEGLGSADRMRAFYADPAPGAEHGPPIRARMAAYRRHATALARPAADAAMHRGGTEAADVGQVVAVSCTGFDAPGIDITLMETLGLRPDTGRTMIGFMGCHGAINGLRVARALAIAEPGRRVLLCAVELCSLHYQYARDTGTMIANALFSDGAAAAVIGADATPTARDRPPPGGTPPLVRASGSCLMPDSADAMTWRIGDHGFEMTLSTRVPALIEAHLRPWLDGWLAQHGLSIDRVGSWAIHPGGPRILDAVGAALGLPSAAIAPSREVLAECGNMSSPTVLFILERLHARGAPGPTVLLAFGPGLVAEAALLG